MASVIRKKLRQTTLTGHITRTVKRTKKAIKETTKTKNGKQYIQSTIRGETIYDEDSRHFGDEARIKDEDAFRFGGQNAAMLPVDRRHTKSRRFVSTIREYDFDGFCTQEVGLDWDELDARDQWHHRTDNVLQEQSIFAHNTHEKGENGIQYGGTGVIVTDDLRFSIKERGRDNSGLGRWCWIKFQRKEWVTRLVSVYRPCDGKGDGSVASQHRRYFYSRDLVRNPRQAILEDLGEELDKWVEAGENVLVIMDAKCLT